MADARSAAAVQGRSPSLAERLERGEVIYYPTCPFPVLEGEDGRFLREQQLANRAHKNIGYNPQSGQTSGFRRHSDEQVERLRDVLATFCRATNTWMAAQLPRYAAGWQLDRVSFRPEEEATRQLRLTARNDLLHVDSFPSRPTNGARILRFFVNVNPTEPRVWITSDTFPALLERFGTTVGLPANRREGGLSRRILETLRLVRRRSTYDSFMLRLHNFLKADEDFQKHCQKRTWDFPPGSAWMVITDTATHAVLRGRYAIEHSWFLPPEVLALPDESPAALLQRACGIPVLNRAA